MRSWLLDKRNGKWLLVLDNVDDAEFLFEACGGAAENPGYQRSRISHLPICEHGSMLITSRTLQAAARLTDDPNMIKVDPMDEQCACALLHRKLEQPNDNEDIRKLAKALEYIPLALVQAAAYIKKRSPRCSAKEYLAMLASSEKSRTNLLMLASQEIRRDLEARNSVLLTWQISFDQINSSRPSAACLLSLLSFYNHQDIPDLLPRASIGLTVDQPVNKEGHAPTQQESCDVHSINFDCNYFEEDISTLQDFLLIRLTSSGTSFVMHRLVQLAARVWLESQDLYQHWASQSVKNLDAVFPPGDYANWKVCQGLYTHARSTLDLKLSDEEGNLHKASLLQKAAWYSLGVGSLTDAERLARAAFETSKSILGSKDPQTLSSQGLLASTLDRLGDFSAAESLTREAFATFEETLGSNHPSTLTLLCNLSDILRHQGKYTESEETDLRALSGRETLLGPNDPLTLSTVSHLALTLRCQDKLPAAEEMSRRALAGHAQILGEIHPFTLGSASNLGEVLRCRGDLRAAEEVCRRVVEGCERAYGPAHPASFMSLWSWANVLFSLGRRKEARGLRERARRGAEEVLGREHPTCVSCWGEFVGEMGAGGGGDDAERGSGRLELLPERWKGRWGRWLAGGGRMKRDDFSSS